jgi:L-alanine-DL-glutamate epimerase-like enolase superfamily enzyme
LLPPGGARNAVDCALWELDAKRRRMPVWEVAELPPTKPLVTTFTLGADDPAVMAAGARKYAQARSLKLKLTGDLDLDVARVRAVRAARPDVWMGVDANQGYGIELLDSLIGRLTPAKISLLEQPLKRGREADLEGFHSPIPIAADESALSFGDLAGLPGRFDVVNIKLDKCGGLTEGLAMAHEARRLGLKVMVGNMVGTSLAMAPAFVLGQLCDVVDLDGPIFLAQDRKPSMTYVDGAAWSGDDVWGATHAGSA